MTIGAARRNVVIVPSPLAGEGIVVSRQREMGEGVSSPKAFYCEATPSPNLALLLHLHALSHEGRGHDNKHPSSGGSA
jgi:hypothetical protein